MNSLAFVMDKWLLSEGFRAFASAQRPRQKEITSNENPPFISAKSIEPSVNHGGERTNRNVNILPFIRMIEVIITQTMTDNLAENLFRVKTTRSIRE